MKFNQTTRRSGLIACSAVSMMLLAVGVGGAGPITYNVNQTIGAGSVIGTIQTDGAIGTLTASDITAWNLDLNGVSAFYNLTNSNSVVYVQGSDVSASLNDLYFNFSGGDDGIFLFQQSLFSGQHYYCDATETATCFQGATVTPEAFNSPSEQNVALSGKQIIGTALPEPMTLSVVCLGLAGAAAFRRRRKMIKST